MMIDASLFQLSKPQSNASYDFHQPPTQSRPKMLMATDHPGSVSAIAGPRLARAVANQHEPKHRHEWWCRRHFP